jgi:hypothetical protein
MIQRDPDFRTYDALLAILSTLSALSLSRKQTGKVGFVSDTPWYIVTTLICLSGFTGTGAYDIVRDCFFWSRAEICFPTDDCSRQNAPSEILSLPLSIVEKFTRGMKGMTLREKIYDGERFVARSMTRSCSRSTVHRADDSHQNTTKGRLKIYQYFAGRPGKYAVV